ncbi:hypothetical protein OF387_07560 [Lentilactobacillus hilgardii]|nr:hypothetical protein [Lentilactobacillus hilgardii]MCV3741080.1 hypothetical protein [Lentilactobacillus hilgardii]
MRGSIIGISLVISALLSGCGGNTKPQAKGTTPLTLANAKGNDIGTNNKGKYVLQVKSSSKAKISAYYLTGGDKIYLETHSTGNGKYTIPIALFPSENGKGIYIVAKAKAFKSNSKKIYLVNVSKAHKKYSIKAKKLKIKKAEEEKGRRITAAQKESQRKADESSTKAKEKATKELHHHTSNSANNNPHTHGLSGLKYQADKYLKKDNSVAFYHPVKVLGYDNTKPYVANIEFKANDESKATMKDGAVSILEGVKKADYKDFSNIKISFTQNVADANGKTLKNIPVLGYSFSRSTLESIDPNNMDSSDLSKVADSHFDKHVEDD